MRIFVSGFVFLMMAPALYAGFASDEVGHFFIERV
jgi:hypothetical protein